MDPRWSRAPAGHWKQKLRGPDDKTALYFSFFNEIAIIGQLSGRLLEDRLPAGFLVSHFAVLNHLVRRGGSTPLALARAFQVPKATMTHTLAGLAQAGLVRLLPNPGDGRSKCVMLTDKGRRFRAEAIARLTPDFARMADHVDVHSLAAVLPLLSQLRSHLDSSRDV